MTSIPRCFAPLFPLSVGRGGGSADLLTGNRYGSDFGQRGALDGRQRVLAGRVGQGRVSEKSGMGLLMAPERAEILGLEMKDRGL